MKLYIARHGETQWNKEKRIQGRADLEMNETGISQVEAVAKGLSEVKFDAVYSSPLKRAVKTAQIISGTEDVIIDDKIYELDFGPLEGVKYGNLAQMPTEEITEKLKKVRAFFGSPDRYIPLDGGETYEAIIKRAEKFLNEIKKKYKNQENILVVSHATFIHVLIGIIEKIPLSKLWSSIHIPNCSVSIIEFNKDEYSVLELGKIFY